MRIWLSSVGVAAYAVFVLAVTMVPTPVDKGLNSSIDKVLGKLHQHGLPVWFQYEQLEFTANIAFFVPLGFFLALLVPLRVWWLAILVGPVFSLGIEFTQRLFLPERFASVGDIVANSIGSLIGTVLAFALRAVVDARDRRVISAALAHQPTPSY